MHAKKEYKEIIAELERQGWSVDITSSMHYKATPPDKTKPLIHFSTSVDPHAILNNIKKLRQNGFVWPPPSKKEEAAERREGIERRAGLSSAVLETMALTVSAEAPTEHSNGAGGDLVVQTEPKECPSCHFQVNMACSDPFHKTFRFADAEPPEERMDRLFKELKEARAYCALTVEQEEDCRRAFKKAQEELTLACKESADAGEAFTKKKAEFNAALEAAA